MGTKMRNVDKTPKARDIRLLGDVLTALEIDYDFENNPPVGWTSDPSVLLPVAWFISARVETNICDIWLHLQIWDKHNPDLWVLLLSPCEIKDIFEKMDVRGDSTPRQWLRTNSLASCRDFSDIDDLKKEWPSDVSLEEIALGGIFSSPRAI
jgi:hypothetical protein